MVVLCMVWLERWDKPHSTGGIALGGLGDSERALLRQMRNSANMGLMMVG